MRRHRTATALLLAAAVLSCLFVEPVSAQRRRGPRSLRNAGEVQAAFRDKVAAAAKSTVRILVDGVPAAMGCVVRDDGLIVTKASLIGDGQLFVKAADGEAIPADRMGVAEEFDLLMLKPRSGHFQPVRFAETAPPVGKLIAVPQPDGDILAVGMVTLETGRATLRRRGPEPPEPSAFMGVRVRPRNEGGLLIFEPVDEKSPAGKAGLTEGDTLRSIDNTPVNQVEELLRVLARHKPGDQLSMTIERDGVEKTGEITLGTRDAANRRRNPIDQWGGGNFSKQRYNFPEVVTHDAYIQPLDCGGPVVTSDGDVIGINIARALRVATYAVPGSRITELVAKVSRSPAPVKTAQPPQPKKAEGASADDNPDEKAAEPAPEPIRAAGIDGSLLLYTDPVGDAALDRFLELAKQDRSRIVVIDNAADPTILRLQTAWDALHGETFHRIAIRTEAEANDAARLLPLADATGLWITPGTAAEWLQPPTALAAAVSALQARSGIVAGPAALLAEKYAGRKVEPGSGLLPGSLVSSQDTADQAVRKTLAANPLLVHYHLPESTALVVRGRYLFAVDGRVDVSFADSATWPAQDTVIEGRQLADLTALRRIASRRRGPVFPPKKPAPPVVESGTLMIVGGGGLPQGLMERFLKEAGGDQAVIAVIPISMPESQLPPRDRMAQMLRRMGAKEVHVLKQRTPQESDSAEVLDILSRTTGIWFGGGRQWRFIDAYEGTQAAQLMHDVLRRGGVIAGSSAGASIQGDYMARGNPLGPASIMADGYETGLQFLPGVAIDQHFTQRNRLRDLASLVDRYPQLLGIGIDETTAIIVQKNIADVVGRNRVCFYDRRKPVPVDGPDYEAVYNGGRYDLVSRTVKDPGETPTAEESPGPDGGENR